MEGKGTKEISGLKEVLVEFEKVAREYKDIPDIKERGDINVTGKYYKELTQVAAIAIAAMVDFRMSTDYSLDTESATVNCIEDVLEERVKQDKKFGEMPHGCPAMYWLRALAEELGETAAEVIVSKEEVFDLIDSRAK